MAEEDNNMDSPAARRNFELEQDMLVVLARENIVEDEDATESWLLLLLRAYMLEGAQCSTCGPPDPPSPHVNIAKEIDRQVCAGMWAHFSSRGHPLLKLGDMLTYG
jgi:hypothetical protein